MPSFCNKNTALICGLLVVLVAIVFGQTLDFDFVNYDDVGYLTTNARVWNGLTNANVAWAWTTDYFCNWHPLTWASYLTDASFYGRNAGGFHATNVILHAMNTVLLFVIWRQLTRKVWSSAFIAMLFAIHPLHVESVAWISERKGLLCSFFALLSLWGYVAYAQQRRRGFYIASVALFGCSILSKQALITFPALLLLIDFWPLQRGSLHFRSRNAAGAGSTPRPSLGKLLLEKVPYGMLALVAALRGLWAQDAGYAVRALDEFPLPVRICNAALAYGHYIRQTVWPNDLAVYYPHPGFDAVNLTAFACAAVLLITTIAAVLAFRRDPEPAVGWLWFVGMLLPALGFVQLGVQQRADRYMYFPIIGLFIIFAWLLEQLAAQFSAVPRVRSYLAAGMIVPLAIVAFVQTRAWQDSKSLFEDAIASGHESSLAWNNLGNLQQQQGNLQKALKHYLRAEQLAPNDALTQNNLGTIAAAYNDPKKARDHFERAVELNATLSLPRTNLGALLLQRGQIDEAVTHLEQAVSLDPADTTAQFNLATAYMQAGRLELSVSHFRSTLELNPDHADAHNNLATLLAQQGELNAALVHVRESVRIKPQSATAHYNLGLLLVSLNLDRRVANAHFQQAARLDPNLQRKLQEAN